MAKYLLDTGILLGYIRASEYAKHVEQEYQLMAPNNISLISIVSVGEIYSLAAQFKWGEKKKKELQAVLSEIHRVDISHEKVLERYAEIDAYSQGKHSARKLPNGMTSRNMGKNDIWIAATASILNANLITTDKDFEHLDKEFLEVIYIEQGVKFKPVNN